jgi:2-oxoglutarate/2-oxoacid ferredoxin oxidoreductase subunit beta
MVEVESQCPTYFGRYSKNPDRVLLLKWQRDNSVPVEKARKMKPEEIKGKIVTGIFIEEKRKE